MKVIIDNEVVYNSESFSEPNIAEITNDLVTVCETECKNLLEEFTSIFKSYDTGYVVIGKYNSIFNYQFHYCCGELALAFGFGNVTVNSSKELDLSQLQSEHLLALANILVIFKSKKDEIFKDIWKERERVEKLRIDTLNYKYSRISNLINQLKA